MARCIWIPKSCMVVDSYIRILFYTAMYYRWYPLVIFCFKRMKKFCFFAGEIFFSAAKFFFAGEIFFSPAKFFFSPAKIFFHRRNFVFASQKNFIGQKFLAGEKKFRRRKRNFVGQKKISPPKKKFCRRKKKFVAEKKFRRPKKNSSSRWHKQMSKIFLRCQLCLISDNSKTRHHQS